MKEPEYTEEEVKANLRKNTFDAIITFASRDLQLKYQRDVPRADILAEILIEWHLTYGRDAEEGKAEFRYLFNEEENKILSAFDVVFQEVMERNTSLTFDEFLDSDLWKMLNVAAKSALAALEAIGVKLFNE